jgi:hypothetical protein
VETGQERLTNSPPSMSILSRKCDGLDIRETNGTPRPGEFKFTFQTTKLRGFSLRANYSDRRSSAKLIPPSEDRGCRVVSAKKLRWL